MSLVFAATYIAVLGAEIVGDKLLYTIAVLAGRFSRWSIATGTAAAFMFKMGAAVMVGAAITNLPRPVVLSTTAASFLWIAWGVSRPPTMEEHAVKRASSAAVMLSFSAVAFSEWSDLGQLTAATMTARFGAPLVVWIAAVMAMMTKGVLAITIGARLRQWAHRQMSDTLIRYASIALLLALGTLSMIEAFYK